MITLKEIEQYQTQSFDPAFESFCKAGKLAWYPWVGKNYPSASSKILVILESHYIDKAKSNVEDVQNPLYTRRLVAERCYPQYWWNSPTWNNLNAFLAGRKLEAETAPKLWENIAFYNFVQRPMPSPSDRPSERDFAQGWQAFKDVLNTLKPGICIFAGMSALSHTEQFPPALTLGKATPWGEKINNTFTRPVFSIRAGNVSASGAAIQHPGSFFTCEAWHNWLKAVLPAAAQHLEDWAK